MKISVGMRIYISSSASVDLSAGDDIPKELLEKVPVIFRTTAVEYDKRRFMGNLRATNDLEISYSSSGIVIIKRGELIPDAVLDKVPDAFKTSGVIPPAPSVETNAENIAKNKIAIDTNKTDIADNNVKATKMSTTATATAGEDGVEHWITVASSRGRTHGRVVVNDESDGCHGFIEIDWMKSYANSSFNVLNNGGHSRFISGVRILRESSDWTFGTRLLQIRVEREANFTVSIISDYNNPGWKSPVAVAPVVEDTKAGYQLYGKEITDIKYLGFATLKGVKFGGDVYTDENFYAGGKLVGLDKAKCYVDMDPEDFAGAGNVLSTIGLSAVKYQTPGNNFVVDVATKEVVINKEGYYNIIVELTHTKGSSGSTYSQAKIYKNGNVALGGSIASNINTNDWSSLIVKALGENLVAGDRISVKSNGQNNNSFWSTFSIEEI